MRPSRLASAGAVLLTALWAVPAAAQNITDSKCDNFGLVGGGDACLCPAGFASSESNDCALPSCGGSLYGPTGAGAGQYGNVTNCACSDGWQGPACTVCTSSSVCTSSLSPFRNSSNSVVSASLNTSLVCSAIPTVYAAGQLSCMVEQATIQSLFPGKLELSISRYLNSTLSPGGDTTLEAAGMVGGTGEAWAQLWHDGVEQFACHGGSCEQTITPSADGSGNSSQWVCADLQCHCRDGTDMCGGGTTTSSQNLTSVINTLVGPLTIECSADGSCSFQQKFLNLIFGDKGLGLTSCVFGECIEQYQIDQALGIAGPAASSNSLSGGVIAGLAVVGAIVLLIILIALWGFIARSKARKVVADGKLGKAGGVGVAWSGVGYEVKGNGRGMYATLLAWLRGSGMPARRSGPESEKGDRVGPNGGRVVLRDVCGDLPAGGFCAILGPSGAGKSTLVDILAGRRKEGHVEGKVAYLDGRDGQRRPKIGYVDQSDVLAPTATVYETLRFAARLRLPENVPMEVKDERARTVLNQLGLSDIAETRVGSGEHRGISGGEMRRVSIGIELVANPDVLVLDEPTSGLDSVSAARIVSLLKSLAEDPQQQTTIVASIHQPSSALYHSFHQVCLLANGRQLYFGPGGNAPAEFFARQGHPCPPGYNVADHLLEVASDNPQGLLAGPAAMLHPTRSVASTPDRAHTSDEVSDGVDEKASDGHNGTAHNGTSPLARHMSVGKEVDLAQVMSEQKQKREWWPRSHCATTFLTQLGELSGREWRNLRRDKTLLVAHWLIAVIVGLFSGGLYYKIGITIGGFQNRVGSLFFVGTLILFSALSALNNIHEIRPLFLRERSGRYYSPQAWLASRVIFDILPLRIIPTLITSIIVYWMVGLSDSPARFFKYLLALCLLCLPTTFYNFLLGTIFEHHGIAILLSSLWTLFSMTFAGFFVNLDTIPPVLRWLHWIVPLAYTLEAITVNEVGSGLQIVDQLGGGVPVDISAVVIMETLFGFGLGHYYRNILILMAFTVGTLAVLVVTVVYLLRERR